MTSKLVHACMHAWEYVGYTYTLRGLKLKPHPHSLSQLIWMDNPRINSERIIKENKKVGLSGPDVDQKDFRFQMLRCVALVAFTIHRLVNSIPP